MPEKIENNCENKLESYTDQNVVPLLINNIVDHFDRPLKYRTIHMWRFIVTSTAIDFM